MCIGMFIFSKCFLLLWSFLCSHCCLPLILSTLWHTEQGSFGDMFSARRNRSSVSVPSPSLGTRYLTYFSRKVDSFFPPGSQFLGFLTLVWISLVYDTVHGSFKLCVSPSPVLRRIPFIRWCITHHSTLCKAQRLRDMHRNKQIIYN